MKKLLYLSYMALLAMGWVSCSPAPKQSLTEQEKDSLWCDTTSEVCGITEDMEMIPLEESCPD